jgi:hypothetical protein
MEILARRRDKAASTFVIVGVISIIAGGLLYSRTTLRCRRAPSHAAECQLETFRPIGTSRERITPNVQSVSVVPSDPHEDDRRARIAIATDSGPRYFYAQEHPALPAQFADFLETGRELEHRMETGWVLAVNLGVPGAIFLFLGLWLSPAIRELRREEHELLIVRHYLGRPSSTRRVRLANVESATTYAMDDPRHHRVIAYRSDDEPLEVFIGEESDAKRAAERIRAIVEKG